MSKVLQLLTALAMFCCLGGFVLSQDKPPTLAEKKEAEKAWDALVRAKGGRDKLYSITNILTEIGTFRRLDIFPNSFWTYSDWPFGTSYSVHLWDGAKSIATEAGRDGLRFRTYWDKEKSLEVETEVRTGEVVYRPKMSNQNYISDDRIPFILETKWDKPDPQRVSQIKQGKKKLDVIETRFNGFRMDFIYEIEEMLVLEVKFYDEKMGWWKGYSFSNYTEINGIKMPQSWGIKSMAYNLEKEKYRYVNIKFSFNVDYAPDLFTRPLIATGPDGWKRKP